MVARLPAVLGTSNSIIRIRCTALSLQPGCMLHQLPEIFTLLLQSAVD